MSSTVGLPSRASSISPFGGDFEARSPVECAFVQSDAGRIETLSVEPRAGAPNFPVLHFLVGWWGAASDYIPVMRHFARLGFPCRTFSWRGTGKSDGWSFWGKGYAPDLLNVLRHFKNDRVVLIAHSGASDYIRDALPPIAAEGGYNIEAFIVIAPLARSGSMHALLTWLKPDRTGTTLTRWIRFLGSNIFGVAWFMRNELALRRVLLADHVSSEVVRRVQSQMGPCPFGRYFLSLWRFLSFRQPPRTPLHQFGIPHGIVLHCEHDRNFTPAQQRHTAAGFEAEFDILRGTCHQWFADARSFRTAQARILSWLFKKKIIPEIPEEP